MESYMISRMNMREYNEQQKVREELVYGKRYEKKEKNSEKQQNNIDLNYRQLARLTVVFWLVG